jgi:hypothetical protein
MRQENLPAGWNINVFFIRFCLPDPDKKTPDPVSGGSGS